jgi:hypothetical protein
MRSFLNAETGGTYSKDYEFEMFWGRDVSACDGCGCTHATGDEQAAAYIDLYVEKRKKHKILLSWFIKRRNISTGKARRTKFCNLNIYRNLSSALCDHQNPSGEWTHDTEPASSRGTAGRY